LTCLVLAPVIFTCRNLVLSVLSLSLTNVRGPVPTYARGRRSLCPGVDRFVRRRWYCFEWQIDRIPPITKKDVLGCIHLPGFSQEIHWVRDPCVHNNGLAQIPSRVIASIPAGRPTSRTFSSISDQVMSSPISFFIKRRNLLTSTSKLLPPGAFAKG
jgi:hypothetical protein